jgi:hypothetical protein
MEMHPVRGERVGGAIDIESINDRVRREMVRELHRDHNLPPRAIARILHVDEAWVVNVLRQIRKEMASQPMLFSRDGR